MPLAKVNGSQNRLYLFDEPVRIHKSEDMKTVLEATIDMDGKMGLRNQRGVVVMTPNYDNQYHLISYNFRLIEKEAKELLGGPDAG